MRVLSHAHTTYSLDGELTPAQVAELAAARGFDAVLVSDHFEDLNALSFERLVADCRAIRTCLMVPGYERNWDGYHVLALGVDRWFDQPAVAEWANAVRNAGGLVVAAHPGRYRHQVPESVLDACDAVEVWNSKRGYDGPVGPNPRAYSLLGAESQRRAVCGQDLHGVRHASSVALDIPGREPSRAVILQALREGAFSMRGNFLAFDGALSVPARVCLHVFHAARAPLLNTAYRMARVARRSRRRAPR